MRSRVRGHCGECGGRARQNCLREGELGETSELATESVRFRFLVESAVIPFLGTRSLLGA
jgi:hypothetical protein